MEFIPARLQSQPERHPRPVRQVVIHTTESPQTEGGARAVAAYFQTAAAGGSAHYVADDREVVRCVPDGLVAAGAPGANQIGLQVEHVAHAGFTPAQWQTPYSEAMLRRSAQLVAAKCAEFDIPVRKLSPAQVAQGLSGICGHWDVTLAFHRPGGHTDPGPAFPWAHYLDLVRAAQAGPITLEVDGKPVPGVFLTEAGHSAIEIPTLCQAMGWEPPVWDGEERKVRVTTR